MKKDLELLYLTMLLANCYTRKHEGTAYEFDYVLKKNGTITKGRFVYNTASCEIADHKAVLNYWMDKFLG